MRVHLLSLAIIGAQGFSALQKKPVDTIPVGTLCDELVRFANLGCGEATPEQDKRDCEAEMKRHSTSGTMFGLDDAQAALDAVPQELLEELEQVDVVSKCVRDEVRRIVALDVEARLTQHKRALESPDGGYVAILAIVYGMIKTFFDNGGKEALLMKALEAVESAVLDLKGVNLPERKEELFDQIRGILVASGGAVAASMLTGVPEWAIFAVVGLVTRLLVAGLLQFMDV